MPPSHSIMVRASDTQRKIIIDWIILFFFTLLKTKLEISIIRIIPIKDNDKFKSNKLELGVITINLSNIRSTDGTQLYKNIFKTSKVPT